MEELLTNAAGRNEKWKQKETISATPNLVSEEEKTIFIVQD